jgi:tetratricopeptide (TPR) repeat protein
LKWINQAVKRKSNYKLIKAGKRALFGRCFNLGMEASSGEYIVLLRDHVIVANKWCEGMLGCINMAASTGIVGPMTNGKTAGRQYIPDSNPVSIKQFEIYAGTFHETNRHRRIPSWEIAGFCMVFRREFVQKIGGFDEDLEPGSECNDYCLRGAMEGYQHLIAGDVFTWCRHLPGKGDDRSFANKWRHVDVKSPASKRLGVTNALKNADKLFQAENLDEAVLELIDGIKHSADELAIYHRLAEILIDSKRFEQGLETINAIPEDKKDNRRTHELTAYCKAGLGLNEEALQLAEKILSLNKSSVQALNLRGILAHNGNCKGSSEEFFKEAIAADHGDGRAYTNLGLMAWEDGRKDDALAYLEKGFILTPTVADCITAYHSAVLEFGSTENTEVLFREARALYPENRRIAFLLIDILIRQKAYKAAIHNIREAMVVFGIDDGILSAAQAIMDRLAEQHLKKTKKKPRLTVAVVVKDKQDCLAQCLLSAIPIADEIVVVDTGSADKTKAIAKTFGAQVYDFECGDDFSQARNLSLSKASGNWVLVLDADEIISSADYDRFINIVKNKPEQPVAYSIITGNHFSPTSTTGWPCNNGERPDEEGIKGSPSPKIRLFTNDERIRFEDPAQEIIELSLLKHGIKIEKM